jgi:hypothetical protein
LVDILSAVLGVAVGAVGVALVSYFAFYRRPRALEVKTTASNEGRSGTTVPRASLEKSRREMRALTVERDLLSSALMKVYEAETDGRITKEEREMIAKKYSDQIKELQSKMKDAELIVEVGELEALREELVSMFQDKIQNLEARLDQAKERLDAVAPQLQTQSALEVQAKKEAPPKVEKPQELEKIVEKKAKPELSESEKRVRELRNEIMGALTSLERVDVEKKQQET